MEILNDHKVKIHLISTDDGNKIIDAVTTGTVSRRGDLLRIEYAPTEGLPDGNTVMILHYNDSGKVSVKRITDVSVVITAENGSGEINAVIRGHKATIKLEQVCCTISENHPSGAMLVVKVCYKSVMGKSCSDICITHIITSEE